jgi:hypothetical protein
MFLAVALFAINISFVTALLLRNPDTGHNGVLDDRSSFTKPHIVVQDDELSALSLTARGDKWHTLHTSSSHVSMALMASIPSLPQEMRTKPTRYAADWRPGHRMELD